jgi:Putative esterase
VGLTSPGLPYLLALLAFVVLLVIVLCWPALGRRGWPQIGLRVLSLIALQVLVLGLIFVVVNRSGEFYSSWSDLLGTDDGAASVVAASHLPVSTQRELTVTGTTPVRLPFGHAGGVLDSVRIRGELSGIVATGHVYLPAAYLAHGPHKDYPVLTVISDAAGGGGSPYSAGRVAQTAATEIAANRMGPLIILMLPATIGRSDQGCLNLPPVLQPHGRGSPSIQAETFFVQDVPGAVEAAFRAASQASHWGLLGDQTGGYCALQLAMDNSTVFSAAVAPRAAYTQPPDAAVSRIRGPFALQDDLIWQLTHLPLQPVSVLFAGPGSATGAGLAEPFIQLAQRPMRVSTAQLAAGTAPLARILDWAAITLGSPPASGRRPGTR